MICIALYLYTCMLLISLFEQGTSYLVLRLLIDYLQQHWSPLPVFPLALS